MTFLNESDSSKGLFAGLRQAKPQSLFSSATSSGSATPFLNLKFPNAPKDHDRPTEQSDNAGQDSQFNTDVHPAVKLSRLPAGLNRKTFLQNHFNRFGSISRIVCQPSLDTAYVAFDSVIVAQRARKFGHDPVSVNEDGLPGTVLLTLARCRLRSASGSGESLPVTSFHDHGLFSGKQLPTTHEVAHRLPILPVPFEAPRTDFLFRSAETSTCTVSGELFSLPEKVEQSEVYPKATLEPTQAVTLEERISVLQAHYKSAHAHVLGGQRMGLVSTRSFSDDLGDADDQEDFLSTAVRGACQDMCPELERYSREAHQRISLFECIPSSLGSGASGWQLDHTRAVKDYQRSSADQPVPLPCELRPTNVINRTMSYLLAAIADRPEQDTSRNLWKPWYEFMWTRTRAIRKDIVQQRLCCPVIVGVVERIARFHIFCAARLVDQPVDAFDPRINSENLTQCLQTLKEMYNDLTTFDPTDSATLCPCEPEFRGYMLLMKLNDQFALNDVQQLAPHLLRSTPVRFAVRVHEAVTTNNYIRFFRLVRQASCLDACLLHRYFLQMRGHALIRLASSFGGHPRREVQYPLDTLTRQLAFENPTEARRFCENWGLSVVDQNVIFDKHITPQPPELPWRERRSVILIEQKRSGVPLSILFNNGPLPDDAVIPYPVHSSFDSDGHFIGSKADYVTSDLAKNPSTVGLSVPFSSYTNIFSAIVPPASVDSHVVPISSVFLPSAAVAHANDPILNTHTLRNWVNEWLGDVLPFENVAHEVWVEELVYTEISNTLIDEFLLDELIELADEETSADKRQFTMDLIGKQILDDLLGSVLLLELTRVAQASFVITELVSDLLFEELLPELIRSIAQTCCLKLKADAHYRQRTARSVLHRIRQTVSRRKEDQRRRALMRTIPACPPTQYSPLTLIGQRANYLLQALRQSKQCSINQESNHYPGSLLEEIKRPRFSKWSTAMNYKLTWDPIQVNVDLFSNPLGICCNIDSSVHEELQTVSNWLERKLCSIPLLDLQSFSDEHVPPKLSAIICLGHLKNDVYPDLPILNVTMPSALTITAIKDNINHSPFSSPLVYKITLPNTESGVFVPNPCWSSNLKDGINWLSSILAQYQKNVPTRPPITRRLLAPPRLADLVWQLVDLYFLRPMADLSSTWHSRGLVDPSPTALFGAYHLALRHTFHQLPNPSVVEQLYKHLCIPSQALDILSTPTTLDNSSIVLEPRRSVEFTDHHMRSWSQYWYRFVNATNIGSTGRYWLEQALCLCEQRFKRTLNLMTERPLSGVKPVFLFAPWLSLCMTTVRDRVDRIDDNKSSTFLPGVITSMEFMQLICFLLDQASQQVPLILDKLSTHFTRLNEPAVTYTDAMTQLVLKSRQNQIDSALLVDVPKPFSQSNMGKSLDELFDRLRNVESSLTETLQETKPFSVINSSLNAHSQTHTSPS